MSDYHCKVCDNFKAARVRDWEESVLAGRMAARDVARESAGQLTEKDWHGHVLNCMRDITKKSPLSPASTTSSIPLTPVDSEERIKPLRELREVYNITKAMFNDAVAQANVRDTTALARELRGLLQDLDTLEDLQRKRGESVLAGMEGAITELSNWLLANLCSRCSGKYQRFLTALINRVEKQADEVGAEVDLKTDIG
jgi:hypothetical protein